MAKSQVFRNELHKADLVVRQASGTQPHQCFQIMSNVDERRVQEAERI